MVAYKLAILICTLPDRQSFLLRLMEILLRQKTDEVVIFTDDRVNASIGEKRNHLLAKGVEVARYVAFIDDDDIVSGDYVKQIMKGIEREADCCSLTGVITDDGTNPRKFEHSIIHRAYETVTDTTGYALIKYLRYPNHLNAIKSEIAGRFQFPEINHGEDTDWATQIFKSGLLKFEHWIEDIIYYYEYRSNK